ncbi:SusC/RagA family TonB-linked outer membrane protein [Marinilongibacter aquaticus]|uniref:SusC/RagA family TonB-linked outer membrane protein n=1 Tax=Marinilongibacter aquaticus TaxID=2975157 RepID=UPI0021BCFBBB|nr:SusC/RagA family TonB-linked outer membrane protein [Marinilongibacter aquaticus]UBM60718.1 SusC/RagA family TonB-linked outer membrane protein [Marinilongibacter aquaticus]
MQKQLLQTHWLSKFGQFISLGLLILLQASMLSAAPLSAIQVSGTVTDSKNEAMPGVSVIEKGTTNGTFTDESGKFTLTVQNEDAILVVSSIGFVSQEISVGNQSIFSVQLDSDTRSLDEVVVTALGFKREERALGYATQKVMGGSFQTVKGVSTGTSLTGKVAGLWVKNSTEFNEMPNISLRGETPLVVIDGVPYNNISLYNIAQDDIESIDVLKGPTASALYGSRGGSGAIVITTKKGSNSEGLTVTVNSNNMFNAGFLMFPDVQKSYSVGMGGVYDPTDYVWGQKLDIGIMANQWNPISKQMEMQELTSKGRNNFQDFLVPGLISNNSVSVAQTGKNGSFRASAAYINNKGQYPNLKSHSYNFTLSGEMKVGDRFKLTSSMGYNKRDAPQVTGAGYGNQGYIYNILIWMGPEYRLADYKDNYWLTPNVQQNWHYHGWYDNPYMIANEKIWGQYENKLNANVTANYKLFEGANLIIRPGFDFYSDSETKRNPPNILSTRGWDVAGLYSINKKSGYSFNGDAIITYQKTFGKLGVDALAGGAIYKLDNNNLYSSTRGGILIPGYYSLNNSVERPNVSVGASAKQVNSIYGKLTLAYNNFFFLDATGRNDWSSTMPSNSRSYFYPSLGGSLVMSEILGAMPTWLDFWKLRGSWTLSKSDLGIYANNQNYSTTIAAWNSLNSASYPTTVRNAENILPETFRTWEIGTAAYFLKKRFKLDVAYFNKFNYNRQVSANISSASGFYNTLINWDETLVRRGLEVTLDAAILKQNAIKWDAVFNYSFNHRYYKDLAETSANNPWTKAGERIDTYTGKSWVKDPEGNLVHRSNGLPLRSDYTSLWGYTDPKFLFGFANTLSYKNFTLMANFDGRVGGLMENRTLFKMWDTGSHPDSDNQWRYDEVVNHNKSYVGNGVVVTSGDVTYDNFGNITSDSRVFAPNEQKVSYQDYARSYGDGTFGATDATFIKLREVSLGYNLPKNVASAIGARSATISLTGQNVWMWTKAFRNADPDKGNDSELTSPSVRYVGGNITLTF